MSKQGLRRSAHLWQFGARLSSIPEEKARHWWYED